MNTAIIEKLYILRKIKLLEEIDGHFIIFIYHRKNSKDFIFQHEHGSFLPIYYHENLKQVIFSTNLKYLLKNSGIKRKINLNAAQKFLYWRNLIPDESTLVEGVKTLVPQRYFLLNLESKCLKTPLFISGKFDSRFENSGLDIKLDQLMLIPEN
jgi:asparagine synthetase B (glutamine-hydrolysing)